MPTRRREAIAAALDQHFRTKYGDGAASTGVEPPPLPPGPLVSPEYAATPEGEPAALTIPDDVIVNQAVFDAVVTGAHEVGLGRAWVQKLIDFDAATLDEAPNPADRPDPGAVDVARGVVGLFPTPVQRHVHARRHLERPEFVTFVAKAGGPLLRRSSIEQTNLRNQIMRAYYGRAKP